MKNQRYAISQSVLLLWLGVFFSQATVTYSQRRPSPDLQDNLTRPCCSCGKSVGLPSRDAGGDQSADTSLAGAGLGNGGLENFLPGESTKTLHLDQGWNMVAVPVTPDDPSKTSLFPAAISYAFGYEGSYVTKDTLQPGVGYWMKFGAADTSTVIGYLRSTSSIRVEPGWNLIGGISYPASVSSIVPAGTIIKSSVFGYRGSYQIVDTIEPGRGYWIKVSQAGKLLLSASPASDNGYAKLSTLSSVLANLSRFNALTIMDSAGRSQTLYFGSTTDDGSSLDRFELPPPAPPGTYDVRFASQRMVETYPVTMNKPEDFLIAISGASYPLTISWQLAAHRREKFVLTDASAGRAFGSILLNENGGVKVSDPKVTTLMLRVQSQSQIPTEFALRQNYPNPFNPVAVIEFDLPEDAEVSLKVYNLVGQEVATLKDNEKYDAGTHQVEFNAADFASGVYFYRILAQSGGKTFTDVKKMILIK